MRLVHVLSVWFGGMAGTAARVALTADRVTVTPFPLETFLINLVGAGALGLLVERLARCKPGERRRVLGLLAGTGFLGGLTTYSVLALDSVQLIRHGQIAAAAGYRLGTLVVGAGASWLATVLGRARDTGE